MCYLRRFQNVLQVFKPWAHPERFWTPNYRSNIHILKLRMHVASWNYSAATEAQKFVCKMRMASAQAKIWGLSWMYRTVAKLWQLVNSDRIIITKTSNNRITLSDVLSFKLKSGHLGLVVDKVALGQVFSEHFGFPSQFSFHQWSIYLVYHSQLVQWARYNPSTNGLQHQKKRDGLGYHCDRSRRVNSAWSKQYSTVGNCACSTLHTIHVGLHLLETQYYRNKQN
jgi:hypothetical protein